MLMLFLTPFGNNDLTTEIDFSELIAKCLQEYMDPPVLEAFRDFLRRNRDSAWMIVSDYHMEKNSEYENYVAVFTVLPAAEHYITLPAMDAGLPTKLSQSDVTDRDIEFLRNLDHFTFAFVSDKKFRPAAPTVEMARASIDKSLDNMMNWTNAKDCQPIIAEFRRFRSAADANGFNLKLFNHMTLTASFLSAIALIILRTIPTRLIYWVSDRDAITSNFDGIVHTIFRLNMHAFAIRHKLGTFDLAWFGESPESQQSPGKKKALPFAPFIRVPDYIAAPVAAAELKTPGLKLLDKEKYKRILAYVIADNPNVAVLRLVNDPGWGIHRCAVSLTPFAGP